MGALSAAVISTSTSSSIIDKVSDKTNMAADGVQNDLELMSKCCDPLVLDQIIKGLRYQIRSSLSTPNTINMLPCFLSSLPTGLEHGNFLAVDLGGSTFRVAFVDLSPEKQIILSHDVYPVTQDIKTLPGDEFFKWMAVKVKKATDCAIENGLISANYNRLKMGLSWSFPIKQTSHLSSGTIFGMGKGYTVESDIAGWDLKKSFESWFSKLGCNVEVAAIVNDGGASMITMAYHRPGQTRMSLILGTGINAAVMTPFELVNKEAKLSEFDFPKSAKECMFNTEASMLGGDGVIPITKWDRIVDETNERQGFQPLEMCISGRYMGELARLILRDLAHCQMLTSLNENDDILAQPYSLDSGLLSKFESIFLEHSDIHTAASEAKILFVKEYPQYPGISLQDIIQMHTIFSTVSNRSCALTAATLVALASEMLTPANRKNCAVACTGAVIEKYSTFKTRTQRYLELLSGPRQMDIQLYLTENGSIIGPSIAAAMASV